MKTLRSLVLSLLCLSFSLAVVNAADKTGEEGTTEGTFVGVDQGDYTHFKIKDKKGVDASFIVLRPDDSVNAFLKNSTGMKGRKVRVFWKMETIPEAGGKEKTVTKVEERKALDH